MRHDRGREFGFSDPAAPLIGRRRLVQEDGAFGEVGGRWWRRRPAEAKALKPSIRIIGVEPVGAPTLHESVRAGHVVELAEITTKVPTMAARRTEPVNLDHVRRHDETIVLVSDDGMREAAGPLWDEFGIAADLSGAALAALLTDRFRPRAGEQVCALVSGAGADGLMRRS